MTITTHKWPPDKYQTNFWPPNWLRYEVEYPESGRPSRLLAHNNVPYLATISGEADLEAALKTVAAQYLESVRDLLGSDWQSPEPETASPDVKPLMPDSWHDALGPSADLPDPGEIKWLNIWPPIGTTTDPDSPTLASWNLSQQADGGLPAFVVMTGAEVYFPDEDVMSYSFGVRVPMAVEALGSEVRVIIRSITVEHPAKGYFSVTEGWASRDNNLLDQLTPLRTPSRDALSVSILGQLTALSAKSAFVDQSTMNAEQLLFSVSPPTPDAASVLRLTLVSKAASTAPVDADYSVRSQFPISQSYQIVSAFDLPIATDSLASTEVCPLVSNAANPGAAEVFVQTPSGWVEPSGISYLYTLRRPTREDEVLETYRLARDIGPATGMKLEADGFEVRRCPNYVPDDKSAGPGVKSVPLPGGEAPAPRRNDYSAIMAYCYSLDFFNFLNDIGLPPSLFVVRAQKTVEVFYRYGIFPGPGRSGRTINAQVAFDCEEAAQSNKPKIQIRLALANLNRWSRPKNPNATPSSHPDDRFLRPEPLGIASSGRWMLHEFGHYLIAARLGKLEFDFAHSAGDALAAVWYDPYSRLNHTRGDVSENFRGITYPFVFTTRRHDRSPLLGWAWYGSLNRSVLAAPPVNCETLKGYLTEQVLSSSIFRLYRAIGGDTNLGGAPDHYIRYRASFMTLYLLIRAIAAFSQSPSKAEMLELGMEDASQLMTTPIDVPAPPHGIFDYAPAPPVGDTWSGGVSHKVVRWAFEAQGMFVEDVLKTTNGPGLAAPVDIYVLDNRPTDEVLPGGTTIYGPGSYAPVSLDWTGDRKWMVDNGLGFTIGNRGQQPAGGIRRRMWLGRLLGDMSQDHWDLGDNIDWILFHPVADEVPELIAGREDQVEIPDMFTQQMEMGGATFVILLESSCDDDLANSDPQALLAAKIDNANGDKPPVKPRALADLVAGDNNLGLMLIDLP
ncbi:hypothetical protein DL239_18985 [Sedimentitalea sp. CY04]|uniref:Uncharacterized protein n=1 Tax=Parasedimentitalea denitrificans TaxID=2211118 RepID=A0ABX0WBK4_9RHOB|nr:hypothetical protein [Sedimentitalea sp. CY04]NIZ63055.1 hypothetical protein [Sedimentitalea sp. CY04]